MEPGSPQEWTAIVSSFMQDHVRRAHADGVVLGVSGGLDSAVVASLATRCFGPQRVHPFLLPAPDSDPQDLVDGRLVCDHLGLEAVEHAIGPSLAGLETSLGPLGEAAGNAKARLRMTLLYAEAQRRGCLVAGTGNKSELLIGYFTKHGDGGNDFQPIGDLYKTQVRALAEYLGLPPSIIDKPPSAGLRPGQTDEGDLGMSYEQLDRILKGIELNRSAQSIATRLEVDLAEVRRVEKMVRATEHKRHAPLVPKIGARTVGIDWRRSVHWDA